MSLSDVLMILATAISPLIAVQVTRYLDDRNDARGRKLNVFRTLMATRAYRLSPIHVEALNTIELVFSSGVPKEKRVLDFWQQYLDHLISSDLEKHAWTKKQEDLLSELLQEMGKVLGYDFNKTQIRKATYAPGEHGQTESDNTRIRELTTDLLQGQRSVSVCLVRGAAVSDRS